MSTSWHLLILILLLHNSVAWGWGARSPESHGSTHQVFNHDKGTYETVKCTHGMTSARGTMSTSRKLAQNMRDVANAAGYSQYTSAAGANTTDRMKKAIDYLMRNKYPESKGDCALFVRRGLASAGLVPNLPLGHANAYVGALSKYCFSNAIKQYPTPESAPPGAVLVYKGINTRGDKNARYGHVEVKTAAGYVSDYYSANPRTGRGSKGRNRQLIGVMIKKGNGDFRSCRK